ncbi:Superkiller protein 3 [Puttea exsequens]|nr:Superkiller protein 3 [Puttea exsequens]
MSSAKTALKAAKAALEAHRYEDAIEQVKAVLAADANNYNANVFLGLACEKLDQYEASEAAYRAAITAKNKDPLAWQGLISLYERQAGKKLDEYHDAAMNLAQVFMEKDDRTRCQSVLDKYAGDAKKYGSRSQFKHSLEVYLPTGPLYHYLEGRVPQPALTYAKIADIVESEEKEKVNTEIGQRRTRLGAKIDQVTADVRREVLERSQLEDLYGAIIDWTNDDEVRRQYDEKLLQRAYDALVMLPVSGKPKKMKQVTKLANGLVILKHPFLLAWKITLDWSDVAEISELDAGLLREYIVLFPDDGLSKVLRGYLDSEISSSLDRPATADSIEDEDSRPLSAEDRLILMSEGIEDSTTSILAYRLMTQYYQSLEEHESAVTIARRGLECRTKESQISGLSLTRSLDALSTTLATALVYFQAPRHHPESTEIFEGILKRKPTETSALIGIGLILEEEESYAEAVDYFRRALQQSTALKIRAEAAWCKAMVGDVESGLCELEACISEMEGSDARTKSLRAQTLYRIGMCIWNRNDAAKARQSRDGAYTRFVASLQTDLNFAPAYTSLGIYYADYAKDKKRARKCFQKAFELSSSEVEAAERLAQSFAKTGEWDLVETVAQRVVESGKVKQAPGSKKKAVSWPFAALGVVQLNKQEYAKSIVSFQSALRLAPADFHYWVGLGESYHNSGRYVAATKALEEAERLEDNAGDGNFKDKWFSRYMLANVRRELGEYDNAIGLYEEVLKTKRLEFGVSIALLQCLVEGAWHSIKLGFFGRAAEAARKAIHVARDIAKESSDAFNLWKAVGDACSIFTCVQPHADRIPVEDLRSMLETGVAYEAYDILEDVDEVGASSLKILKPESNDLHSFLKFSVRAALLAQKRAIYVSSYDTHARAVAWYNLGWTEHRAYVSRVEDLESNANKRSLRYLKAAVQAFKRAIELESGNAEFWNSLGIVTTDMSPKVSQHALVRSLYLNDKNARVWTNLGTFYLIQGDTQLANEAFTRAQSCDPEYAQAWLGQGLLASQMAEKNEARILCTHAFGIADSTSTIIKQEYAKSSFDHIIQSPPTQSDIGVIQSLFALHQLRLQISSDTVFEHLSSLFAERVGDYVEATGSLGSVASKLEADFEVSESPVILLRFAQAKADHARASLAERNFESAVEQAETALSLSDDESLESDGHQKVRLSAHMTAGLASYYLGLTDEAISMFRSALEETQGNPDIVCLLSQVLWAKGGVGERDVARKQLFNCVENHPGHVGAITLLAVVALLDEDTDTVEAMTADLQTLRTRDDLNEQQQGKIAQLLTAIATLYPEEDQDLSLMAEAATAVMLNPSKPRGWLQFATFSEEPYPAEVAVLTATKAAPPRGSLDAQGLARAYAGTRRLDDAQRAVMAAPWTSVAWNALSES